MAVKYFISGKLNENCTGVDFNHAGMISKVIDGLEGVELMITIEKLYNRRSNNQNRYLHGVIIPVVQNWFKYDRGEFYSKEEVKAFIYTKVLSHKINFTNINGMEVFTMEGKRFSKMTTIEFNEAKEEVQRYFAEMGCDIPDPKERNILNDFL